MSKILTVTITGPANSGKSFLAQRIANLLRQEGIGATVAFEDEVKAVTGRDLENLDPLAAQVLSDTDIVVNMEQLAVGFERAPLTSSERCNRLLCGPLLPPNVLAERAATAAAVSIGWQEPATA